jgi:hypothetical protein
MKPALTKEEWKQVVGWPYEVSDQGRVRRSSPAAGTRTGLMLVPSKARYPALRLSRNCERHTVFVHKLVAEAFLGPRQKSYQVNHINGVRTDNRATNLEYVTPRENTAHGWRMGLMPRGVRHGSSKLVPDDVRSIRSRAALGESHRSIAKDYPIWWSHVGAIVRRECWDHVV